MFKTIVLVVAIYTIYAISQGVVFAKSGITGKMISKTESPGYFWLLIAVYALLSIALITLF